ncbi:hypothetical protein HNQ07_001123 [Deinococcus metalli]|uniref:Uncharacterized protein n=1 Tax=Deinococcus metalli TaxID=1141878 RepID=A0A7W8NNE3_9DEIO|nr:hypothetical protein [Deinococcus metalli]MBB5375666.1 hypothetical protein [Deinococcus metalli]GHF37946.1 hypothetical protein GCM10017781_13350 [Deinococcus metalli]
MKATPVITVGLTLATLASAQQGGQTTRQMTPEMQARMKQMQPIFDLAQDLRLLPDLEKTPSTAMTKAQAKQLLPILLAIQKAASVQPNDAKKYLSQIEDKIMTDKQLTAMDDLQLKAEQERAARRAQAQAGGTTGGGVRIPGVPGAGGFGPGGFGGGQRTGAQAGGQGAGGQPGQFNPFKQGRQADALKAYIAVLQKK